MSSFIYRQLEKENVLILPIIAYGLKEESLPPFISELKYIKMEVPNQFEYVAKEIIPVLEKAIKKMNKY